MLDQEKFIRGHVRQLASEYHRSRECLLKEWHFDSLGRLVYFFSRASNRHEFNAAYHYDANGYRMAPDTRVQQQADGGRVEIQTLHNGVNASSMDALQGIAFGTEGAITAETSFDAKGVPLRTTFRNGEGEGDATADYLCDEAGRVLEATNYNGTAAMAGTEPEVLSVWGKPGPNAVGFRFAMIPPAISWRKRYTLLGFGANARPMNTITTET